MSTKQTTLLAIVLIALSLVLGVVMTNWNQIATMAPKLVIPALMIFMCIFLLITIGRVCTTMGKISQRLDETGKDTTDR